jgi:protein-S-isoprenylcysteine O-methyltransferase Ste14
VGVGLAILICGVIGLAAAIRTIWRAQTPIDPYKATTALVTDGLFRFSRNPIYVSDTLIYVGLALAFNAWWALALTPVLVWMMQVGVIAREEKPNATPEMITYKRQVRRCLYIPIRPAGQTYLLTFQPAEGMPIPASMAAMDSAQLALHQLHLSPTAIRPPG